MDLSSDLAIAAQHGSAAHWRAVSGASVARGVSWKSGTVEVAATAGLMGADIFTTTATTMQGHPSDRQRKTLLGR